MREYDLLHAAVVSALRDAEGAHSEVMIGRFRGSVAKRVVGRVLALNEGVCDGKVLSEGAPTEAVEGVGDEAQASGSEAEGSV